MSCSILIGRPVNGCPLNGLEYVLDKHEIPIRFSSEKKARSFLKSEGYTETDIKNEGIVFIENIPSMLWRNDDYSDGVKDAVKVITFEMYDLQNIDIPDTVFHRYILPNRLMLEQQGFEKAIKQIELLVNNEEEYDPDQLLQLPRAVCQKTAEDILAIIKTITDVSVKYVLWLAEKDAVIEEYCGDEENMNEYQTSSIILSDLGGDGFLFGYDKIPFPVER